MTNQYNLAVKLLLLSRDILMYYSFFLRIYRSGLTSGAEVWAKYLKWSEFQRETMVSVLISLTLSQVSGFVSLPSEFNLFCPLYI